MQKFVPPPTVLNNKRKDTFLPAVTCLSFLEIARGKYTKRNLPSWEIAILIERECEREREREFVGEKDTFSPVLLLNSRKREPLSFRTQDTAAFQRENVCVRDREYV